MALIILANAAAFAYGIGYAAFCIKHKRQTAAIAVMMLMAVLAAALVLLVGYEV
ncbi:MAG: hypothetical protein Q4C04_08135 [Clostridia bacterium]|nr:hypothetical protein [Clostridia bacterium]